MHRLIRRTCWTFLFVVVACGDTDDSGGGSAGQAAGGGTGVASGVGAAGGSGGGATEVRQSGRVVSFGSKTGVAHVAVALGDRQGTTSEDGSYEILVPKASPFEMIFTAPGYIKTILQEWEIASDVDRGDTSFVSEGQWSTFISIFESIGGVPRDDALGVVALAIIARPPCATTGGATVTIVPSAETTRYVYVNDGGLPSANTSTSAKPLPVHVAIYNVPPGPVEIALVSPTCGQLPWPVTAEAAPEGGSYTENGNARVEPGDAISYLRAYLGR
jgi:hypothetical protein